MCLRSLNGRPYCSRKFSNKFEIVSTKLRTGNILPIGFPSIFFIISGLQTSSTHWYSVQIVVAPVVPGVNVPTDTAAESRQNICTMNGVVSQY